MSYAALPESRYAAIVAVSRGSCVNTEVRFLQVSGDTLEEIVRRALRYAEGGLKICTITIFNMAEDTPRRMFAESARALGEIERLDKMLGG